MKSGVPNTTSSRVSTVSLLARARSIVSVAVTACGFRKF
jgi:hypothetical protein